MLPPPRTSSTSSTSSSIAAAPCGARRCRNPRAGPGDNTFSAAREPPNGSRRAVTRAGQGCAGIGRRGSRRRRRKSSSGCARAGAAQAPCAMARRRGGSARSPARNLEGAASHCRRPPAGCARGGGGSARKGGVNVGGREGQGGAAISATSDSRSVVRIAKVLGSSHKHRGGAVRKEYRVERRLATFIVLARTRVAALLG